MLHVIASFPDELSAELARGLLTSNNIPCSLRLSNAGGALLGGFGLQNGPTELLVREEDMARARDILA